MSAVRSHAEINVLLARAERCAASIQEHTGNVDLDSKFPAVWRHPHKDETRQWVISCI